MNVTGRQTCALPISEVAQANGLGGVFGRASASLAGVENLRRVKARRTHVAVRKQRLAVISDEIRMSAVVDPLEISTAGDCADRVNVARRREAVDGKKRGPPLHEAKL